MRKYTALAVLSIQAGAILGLTKAQAVARSHALKPLQVNTKTGDGTFEVMSPVQFKVGEQFATSAELNKALAESVEPEEVTQQKAKSAGREKAEAAALDAVKAKAKQWDEVQEELAALREFLQEIEALPTELNAQVKAAIEQRRAAAKK
jgi:hypothetical protein